MNKYFKFKNNFGEGEPWWLYAKIIKDNDDGETCQVFMFETTIKENHFVAGYDKPFLGSIDTNKYSYYCDYYEQCSKEEFETALKKFMEDFNSYVAAFLS